MSRIDSSRRAVAFAVVSQVLLYPDETLAAQLPVLRDAAAQLPATVRAPLERVVAYLAGRPPLDLQAAYVATFDLRRRNALYLTYYLNGDTRRRGLAIWRFAELYRSRGFGMTAPELHDFLPAVLELAAECPPADTGVVDVLVEHLPGIIALRRSLVEDASPYADAIVALEQVLPPPTKGAREAAERLIMAGPPSEEVGLDPYSIPGTEAHG